MTTIQPALHLHDLWAAFPVLLILAVGSLVLLADLFFPPACRTLIAPTAGIGLGLSAFASLWLRHNHGSARQAMLGAIDMDRSVLAFTLVFIGCAFLALLLASATFRRARLAEGPFCCLVIFSVTGMIMMAQAADLLVLFLGLEIMSISFYIMVGMLRSELRSAEAALKYFLTGAFASGLMLYGIALLYGTTGTISLRAVVPAATLAGGRVAYLGLTFVLAGFFFKVGAVPFHMWAPDVYDGAPIPVTAFLATGVKAAAVAGLVRVLYIGYPTLSPYWAPIVAVVAALTMIVGNLGAIAQVSLKRLLAYSSIAHAGYLLLAVLAIHPSPPADLMGLQALLFYLVSYTLMTVGAFAVMASTGAKDEPHELLEDYKGIAREHPVLALTLALFMLSLAGIPPTAGFLGKYLVFSAAVRHHYVLLSVIGVLSSVPSVYYYMKLIVYMYMYEPDPRRPFVWNATAGTLFALLICAVGTIALGLMPSPLWQRAGSAVASMF